MSQTPTELLSPYKAALVAAARDMLRAAGTDGIAIEIPASVPPSVVVLGAEDQIGKLLRTPVSEPMLGGRRAGDVPASPLTWEEPGTGPRSWTILMTSEGHGLVGELGSKFEHADERHARIDVIEAEPVLRQITELQRENAELREKVAGQHWISVDERLPGDGVAVYVMNVTAGWERPTIGAYFEPKDGNDAEWQDEHGEELWPGPPTHWMPLPSVPAARLPPASCWSCKREYTAEQRADADGNCPHCGVEIEQASAEEGGAS